MAKGAFTQTFHVNAAPHAASVAILSDISSADISTEYRVTAHSANGITLRRDYRPWWVWVLCIVIFPFGLIALTVTRSAEVIISLSPDSSGGTDVVLTGPRVRYVEAFFGDMPGRAAGAIARADDDGPSALRQ